MVAAQALLRAVLVDQVARTNALGKLGSLTHEVLEKSENKKISELLEEELKKGRLSGVRWLGHCVGLEEREALRACVLASTSNTLFYIVSSLALALAAQKEDSRVARVARLESERWKEFKDAEDAFRYIAEAAEKRGEERVESLVKAWCAVLLH